MVIAVKSSSTRTFVFVRAGLLKWLDCLLSLLCNILTSQNQPHPT